MTAFVGPSYQLGIGKAAFDRSVNLYLLGMETPGKAPFIMDSVPGYALFADLGGAVRGCLTTNDRTFFVAGSTFYEVDSAGVKTARGSLKTSSGPVDIEYGVFQVVMTDGANGYVFTLASNVFQADHVGCLLRVRPGRLPRQLLPIRAARHRAVHDHRDQRRHLDRRARLRDCRGGAG
jgi:hypothetical protein